MGMPRKFKGFINDREWERLGLHQLRPDFRNSIVQAMAAGFDALDQHEPSDESIQHILDLAQADADNMRQLSRMNLADISPSEMASGFAMGDFLYEKGEVEEEEMKQEDQKIEEEKQRKEREANRFPHPGFHR